jgi:hypothetical protein
VGTRLWGEARSSGYAPLGGGAFQWVRAFGGRRVPVGTRLCRDGMMLVKSG